MRLLQFRIKVYRCDALPIAVVLPVFDKTFDIIVSGAIVQHIVHVWMTTAWVWLKALGCY